MLTQDDMEQILVEYEVVSSHSGNMETPAVSAVHNRQHQIVPEIFTTAEWAEMQKQDPDSSWTWRFLPTLSLLQWLNRTVNNGYPDIL